MVGATWNVPPVTNDFTEKIKDEFNGRELEARDTFARKTRLTLENQYGIYTTEIPRPMPPMRELLEDLVVPVLLAAGFSRETIEDYIAVE